LGAIKQARKNLGGGRANNGKKNNYPGGGKEIKQERFEGQEEPHSRGKKKQF